jgi:hypothetical protein
LKKLLTLGRDLDSDPQPPRGLDPDPHIKNADPQHWNCQKLSSDFQNSRGQSAAGNTYLFSSNYSKLKF